MVTAPSLRMCLLSMPGGVLVRAVGGSARPRQRRRGRGVRLAGAAVLTLLLLVTTPALARADAIPVPAPSTAPSGAGRLTPDPQPGPSPQPPGGAPAAPTPAPATPSNPPGSLPWAGDVPPTGTGVAPDEDATGTCPAGATDCAGQPSIPPPPSPQTTPTAPDITGDGSGGGVVGWITRGITSAINSFFRGLVTAALNPLLTLLGETLLTTPTPSQLPAIGQMWQTSWGITVAAYSLLIMIGGITIMMYQTVQTRTSIKEILPRIPLGFLAASLSQFLAGQAIELANPIPAAILGQGLDGDTASAQLRNIILGAIVPPLGPTGATAEVNRSIFVVFLGLFLAGGVVALLCTYIARVVITVALIGVAPLALSGHALPQTEKMAFWWWRAFGACLGIQIAQSFVLIASFKVFFTPGGFTLLGPTKDGVVNLLAALTLIYLLFKIPFWMMPRIGRGGGILGRVIRSYVLGRTLGLLGGRTGTGRANRAPGRRRRRGRRRNGDGDPYARVEADANGQLLLPLTRVPRVRRPPRHRNVPHQRTPGTPRTRPGYRQLSIPFDDAIGVPGGRYLYRERGQWVDRDGQLLLPFEVDQASPPAPPPAGRRPPPTPTRRPGRGPRPRQLELQFDPYRGLRPDRTGQYALPLDGLQRAPRPDRPDAAQPGGATPPRRGGSLPSRRPRPVTGRQLELPFDPYQGVRADWTGQYALPLEGLQRLPRPSPPAPPSPARPGPTQRPAQPVPPRHQQLMLPHMPQRTRPRPTLPGR